MSDQLRYTTGQSRWLLPAWVVSVVLHGAVFIVLYANVHPCTSGTEDASHGSIGLVLHRAFVEGDAQSSNPSEVVQTAFVDDLEPPELLAVSTTNAVTSAAAQNEADDQPTKSPPQPAAMNGGQKATPKQSKHVGGAAKSGPSSTRARLSSPGTNGYAQVSVF